MLTVNTVIMLMLMAMLLMEIMVLMFEVKAYEIGNGFVVD